MIGPLDRLFGNGPFDLNHDGKIDAGETAYINDTIFSEEVHDDIDEEEELRDEIEFMDPEERREALEDAGFDPDDF
ncbi:hypothetical protein [Butyrivibrio sp. AE3009]|uniref:hypothetical protein n=1 Tax=Butyrivibrio sp. AE3009 TaxID=1280666 RepID=UPI0003B7730A|nr:hypothetical protein [Butyrivibrio sp. AE3009]